MNLPKLKRKRITVKKVKKVYQTDYVKKSQKQTQSKIKNYIFVQSNEIK